MKKLDVKKLSFVLKVMVLIVLVCNLIVLFFVPALAALRAELQWEQRPFLPKGASSWDWLAYTVSLWNPFVWHMLAAFGDHVRYWLVLTLFLLICGICTAVILWQAKRVLDTILEGEPFTLGNAGNLRRAAVCCFVISGAALARLAWGFFYYRSIRPLLTYNALFVPVFLMAGLLCMVMSALFRQAAELKAENDLTI